MVETKEATEADIERWRTKTRDTSAERAAVDKFRATVLAATDTICQAAQGREISRTSFDAAKFVVERVMGKTKETDGDQPWDKFLEAIKAN